MLDRIEGTWYIVYTNFPMWLKGDKIKPRFTYTNQDKYLIDEVSYYKNDKIKYIKGYDTPIGSNRFEWKGKGLLGFLKSHWSVKYIDEKNTWMLIHFEKTLFTPEGYDIVARTNQVSDSDITDMQHVMEQNNLLILKRL